MVEEKKDLSYSWKRYPMSFIEDWESMNQEDITNFMLDNKIITLIDDMSSNLRIIEYEMKELSEEIGGKSVWLSIRDKAKLRKGISDKSKIW